MVTPRNNQGGRLANINYYLIVHKGLIDMTERTVNDMPKYIVFNNNTKAVQTTGNDLQGLLSTYHGKAYQIMQVVPLDTREEW